MEQSGHDRSHDEEWSDEKNNRRMDLIDHKYGEGLTAEEAAELANLQEEMCKYLARIAPLPIEEARKLHQELLKRAAESP
jgi:DNA-directed RNA polymerase subunit F